MTIIVLADCSRGQWIQIIFNDTALYKVYSVFYYEYKSDK